MLLRNFDARLTLMDSAQAFHWRACEDGFTAVVEGRRLVVTQADDALTWRAEGAEEEYLARYFDEERDYAALGEEYADYPCAVRALAMLPGLRVLNQPAWEALVAFIISANNNAARIRRMVCALCEEMGEDGGFPAPEVLAGTTEVSLREMGMGYRAPYLIDTARAVAEGFPLDEMQGMSYEEAHARLITLRGVGDKVADCVLLFGCGHASAYPVDVWVGRLSKCWLSIDEKTPRATQKAARRMLGAHAGILQQYLFHCARLGLMPTEEDAS